MGFRQAKGETEPSMDNTDILLGRRHDPNAIKVCNWSISWVVYSICLVHGVNFSLNVSIVLIQLMIFS